jgi:hypothetical protein
MDQFSPFGIQIIFCCSKTSSDTLTFDIQKKLRQGSYRERIRRCELCNSTFRLPDYLKYHMYKIHNLKVADTKPKISGYVLSENNPELIIPKMEPPAPSNIDDAAQ